MDQELIQEKLALYCRTRDVGLRNELVEAHMYLANIVARKYAGRGVDTEDLQQIAAVALIGALERYSCDKGIKFSTFAVPSITGVVKNYFRDRSRTIRMPRSIGERVQKITLAREELTQELMRSPTMAEIAERCGLKVGDVIEAKVSDVKEDGKLDLTLREKAYIQMDADGAKILELLDSYAGVLPFTEKASPEVIKRETGLSKNAFKRAVGHLYKERIIDLTDGKIRKL